MALSARLIKLLQRVFSDSTARDELEVILEGSTGVASDLSNLTAPTLINQDLVPGADGSKNLGNLSTRWGNLYSYNSNLEEMELYDTTAVITVGRLQVNNTAANADLSLIQYAPSSGPVKSYGLVIQSEKATLIRTANQGAGNSTNVRLETGTASGTRGSIILDGSEIDVTSKRVTNVATATADNDAINRLFLDNRSGRWKRYRVNATYFTAAAGTETKNLFTLGVAESIEQIIVKHELSFVGGTTSNSFIEVGKTGLNSAYSASHSVLSAPAGTIFQRTGLDVIESFDSTTQVTVTLTITGENINNLVQGAVDIYVKIAKIHSSTIPTDATLS